MHGASLLSCQAVTQINFVSNINPFFLQRQKVNIIAEEEPCRREEKYASYSDYYKKNSTTSMAGQQSERSKSLCWQQLLLEEISMISNFLLLPLIQLSSSFKRRLLFWDYNKRRDFIRLDRKEGVDRVQCNVSTTRTGLHFVQLLKL